ncbi:hypothetical protein BH23CHL4_BH23CHL4_13220 [soil metagenome]
MPVSRLRLSGTVANSSLLLIDTLRSSEHRIIKPLSNRYQVIPTRAEGSVVTGQHAQQ